MASWSRSSASMLSDMSILLRNGSLDNLTLHCKDGRVSTNTLILAAASPWWASVLDSETTTVFMPDVTCSSLRTYLQAVLHYNRLYAKSNSKKCFRVGKMGNLRELRSFEYPTVSLEIIDQPEGAQFHQQLTEVKKASKRHMKVSVTPRPKRHKDVIATGPALDAQIRDLKPRHDPKSDEICDSDKSMRKNTTPVKISLGAISVKKDHAGSASESTVINDHLDDENGFDQAEQDTDVQEEDESDSIGYDDDLHSARKNPAPIDVNVQSEYSGAKESVLDNSDFKEVLDIDRSSSKDNEVFQESVQQFKSTKNGGIGSRDISASKANKACELKSKLEQMKATGNLCLLASDGISKAKVILNSGKLQAIHGAMHYFDLVSLETLNLMGIIHCINEQEATPNSLTIQNLHIMYKNVSSLIRDIEEFQHVEEEVFTAFQAHPKKPVFTKDNIQEEKFEYCNLFCEDSSTQEYQNPGGFCGLQKVLDISPTMEEHLVHSYVVLSVKDQVVTGGVEIAKCHIDQTISWFESEPKEWVIGTVLKAFHCDPLNKLGTSLKASCRILSGFMMELKCEMETAYRSTMNRGYHKATCRGCLEKFDCLTLTQKRQMRHHTENCSARRDKIATQTLQKPERYMMRKNQMEGCEEAESLSKLSDRQLSLTPQFVSLETAGNKEFLYALTQDDQCMLLLLSGEENVSMVHGAAHILSSAMQIDHRRLYCRLKFLQPYQRDHYSNIEFYTRTHIFTDRYAYKLHSLPRDIDRNVNQKVRSLINKNQPLVFPEETLYFCISNDESDDKLKISETFEYIPYGVDCHSVTFQDGPSVKTYTTVKDLSQLSKISKFVVCQWEPSSSVMVVQNKINVKPAAKKQNLRKREFEYSEFDTKDFDIEKIDRKVRVDKIWSILTSLVINPSILEAALSDACPYIKSNLAFAYRKLKLDLVEKLPRRKEVCQCGITWDTLTSTEYRIWLNHVNYVHEKKSPEFVCPHPGCNNWQKSELALKTHLDRTHGAEKICEKCGFVTCVHHQYVLHVKDCGKVHTCQVCHLELKTRMSLAQHMKNRHSEQKRVACPTCGKIVLAKLLRKHESDMHMADSEKKFQCGVCQKGFNNLSKLRRHENTHVRK